MRKIMITDAFKLSKILNKIEFTNQLKNGGKTDNEELGKIIVFGIVENMYKAENEILEFLADLFETPVEIYKTKDVDEIIKEMIEAKEQLVKLFTSAITMTKAN